MLTPERAANWMWGLWALSWWAASAWRRPAIKRAGASAEVLHLTVTVLGMALVFATPASVRWILAEASAGNPPAMRVWAPDLALSWTLFGLVVVGFAFCWWARIHLGALWSGSVTRKTEHHIVDTGPYALVRHPIYTGLILAAFATAALRGMVSSLVGAGLVVLGFWIKARLEERFLRSELGPGAYDAYAARTPMLIPRPWMGGARS